MPGKDTDNNLCTFPQNGLTIIHVMYFHCLYETVNLHVENLCGCHFHVPHFYSELHNLELLCFLFLHIKILETINLIFLQTCGPIVRTITVNLQEHYCFKMQWNF